MSHLRRAAAAVVCALLLVAGAMVPAQAKPAKVGLVSFVGSSVYGTSAASLTISWPKVKGAKKYRVFVSTTKAKVAKKRTATITTAKTRATIKGLKRDRAYWVQVAAVGGSRSNRVARVTPKANPTLPTPEYSVMTYNICSNACSNWPVRQPLALATIQLLHPDLVGLQEAVRLSDVPEGYAEGGTGRNTRVLYDVERFDPVVREAPICTVDEFGETCTDPVFLGGALPIEGKEAAWAVLQDKASGQRVLFVSAHLLSGKSDSSADHRASQASQLFAALSVAKAEQGIGDAVPVVISGDFNTNRSRSNNARVESVMKRNGFWDTYEQARTVDRQHFNSANPSWRAAPVIGITWGDHVDKVWVKPGRSTVVSWANAGSMSAGRFLTPLPSDHHPVVVRLRVS